MMLFYFNCRDNAWGSKKLKTSGNENVGGCCHQKICAIIQSESILIYSSNNNENYKQEERLIYNLVILKWLKLDHMKAGHTIKELFEKVDGDRLLF